MDAFSCKLQQFSSDLIVECILQHLESNAPSRPYMGGNNSVNIPDDLKKWFRLCETLLQCIRHDLKKYRTLDANNKVHLFKDRIGAAIVISQWYPDLLLLSDIYKEHFTGEESLHKEFASFYQHIIMLQQLAAPIYERQQKQAEELHDVERKDEIVFIYDNSE